MCIRDRFYENLDESKFEALIADLRARAATPEPSVVERIICLLYTSDAADERSSVDLGGRRIIKKKNRVYTTGR